MAPAWGRRAAGGRVGGCCSSCRGVVSTEAAGVEGPIVMRNPRHAAAAGVAGPIKMRNPGTLLDVHVKQGGSFKQPLDKDFSGFAYVYTGEWGRVVPPPPPPLGFRPPHQAGRGRGRASPARPAASGASSGTARRAAQHSLPCLRAPQAPAASAARRRRRSTRWCLGRGIMWRPAAAPRAGCLSCSLRGGPSTSPLCSMGRS